MKFKKRQVRAGQLREGEDKMSGNEQVRSEIQSYLRALDSYPDRFANDPDVTFEEHRCSLAHSAQTEPKRS